MNFTLRNTRKCKAPGSRLQQNFKMDCAASFFQFWLARAQSLEPRACSSTHSRCADEGRSRRTYNRG
jgi:hypothetical protein